LLCYAFLFTLALSLAPRIGIAYLLPAEPPLALLAGLGLACAARRLARFLLAARALAGLVAVGLLLQPLLLGPPYLLDWYNPLAGGVPAARRVDGGGFGQGLEVVASYLNAQPGAARLLVAMPGDIVPSALDALFDGRVVDAEFGQPWSHGLAYFVTYGRRTQDLGPDFYDPRYQFWSPELRVERGGIEYAQVYNARHGIPLAANFGDQVTLEGYGLDQLIIRPGGLPRARLFWRGLSGTAPGTRVVLTLTDLRGRELVSGSSNLDQLAPDQELVGSYDLTLPAQLAADELQLWVGLETMAGAPTSLRGRPAALAPGAPERPDRVILRSVVLAPARR
jgi:hypothetical protein